MEICEKAHGLLGCVCVCCEGHWIPSLVRLIEEL